MSSEALYERYKDALRRGHVASQRGRSRTALTAYAEAASIAPDRRHPAHERRDGAAAALAGSRCAAPLRRRARLLPGTTRPPCTVVRSRSPPSAGGPRQPTRSTRWPRLGRRGQAGRRASTPPPRPGAGRGPGAPPYAEAPDRGPAGVRARRSRDASPSSVPCWCSEAGPRCHRPAGGDRGSRRPPPAEVDDEATVGESLRCVG